MTTWHQCIASKNLTWFDIDTMTSPWQIVARWSQISPLRPQLPYGPLRPFCALPCDLSHSETRVWVQSQARICGSIWKRNQCFALMNCCKLWWNFKISRQYCRLLQQCTSKAELSRHSKCDCIALKAYRCMVYDVYEWRLINSWKYCSDRFIRFPSSSKPLANPLKFRKRPWKTPAQRHSGTAAQRHSSTVCDAKIPPVPAMEATDIESPRPRWLARHGSTWLDITVEQMPPHGPPIRWLSTHLVRAPQDNIK